MTRESPFSAKRYEYAGSHTYYIPPKAFGLLEQPIPTFLVGTRGTGKTTLLRALSWDERLYNVSLHRQLDGKAFELKYIGLYFKLPNVQLGLLDRWLQAESDEDYASIVAFYLDLCWLETIAEALEHLQGKRIVTLSPSAEERFVGAFRAIWDDYAQSRELVDLPMTNMGSALRLMHPLRRTIERFARRRTPADLALDSLPAGQIGWFGRKIGQLLSRALSEGESDPGTATATTWSFRICMDEGEVLNLRQQRVVNSMVRLAEWPVFYLMAYVRRPQDSTGTYLPGQTLQHADRQILVRDDMADIEFKQLVEGVANVRIRGIFGKNQPLNTNKVLGKLDLDGLLERILDRSEDPVGRDLLEEASGLANGDTPPIYETYLRRVRPELGRETSHFARRRQSSASIRKQMVAAYLSICREIGAKPMYASADMLFQISDKCVRDYLWQMESLFIQANTDLGSFLISSISPDKQDSALREAAASKMTLFRERILSAPTEANNFVDGLARITALVQSEGRNYEHIRTPERGIFTYPTPDAGYNGSNLVMIRDAAEAGFLKILDDAESGEVRFRVHASLAPHYGLSYRGAYYSVGQLSDREIFELRRAPTGSAFSRSVEMIVSRLTGRRSKSVADGQLGLPLKEAE